MRVAIVGAGLAGLAAGCALADAGDTVTIFERRPWAGGKTYSFRERETGEPVDNGQHVFMACTTAYVEFLRKLGTLHLTRRQARLRVPVFDRRGRRSDLYASPLPAPLHFAPSFVGYRHLPALEKVRIARALAGIARARATGTGPAGESFAAWLRRHGQTGAAIRDFWDLIAVPTLNCAAEQASAAQALFVFQEGFLDSPASAALGLPAVGLSRLHVDPAVLFIEQRGGRVCLSAEVERLEVDDGRVAALALKDGARQVFDAYVAALPPRQLNALLPPAIRARPPFDTLAGFGYAPIVNLHLWFDAPVADFDFAAFTGTDLQWIFNPTRLAADLPPGPLPSREGGNVMEGGQHLVISLSAADRFMDLTREELRDWFLPEVQHALPRARGVRLRRFAAIKEPEATFVPAPGLRRPGTETPLANLVLAGAHVDTSWPATMESAVRSGNAAAAALAARRAALTVSRAVEPPAGPSLYDKA